MPADIAIVSLMGRERAQLQGRKRLGEWTLRRFKGEASAAAVLTVCDLIDFDGVHGRLLFVGLTRERLPASGLAWTPHLRRCIASNGLPQVNDDPPNLQMRILDA